MAGQETRRDGAAIAWLASLALALGACGGDDTDAGGDGDADADADGDGDADVTLTGRVVGEMVGGASPPLAGVEVEILDGAGDVMDGTQTDAAGRYTVTGDPSRMAFVVAHTTDGYAGQVRAEGIRDGLELYDITLQLDAGLETIHDAVGLTYDAARGTVVLGFNPVDPDVGGEGGSLVPPSTDPPFILVDDTAVSGTRLPPVCPNAGADPCVEGERGDFVFFPNVEPGLHGVTLVQPIGGTCHLRFDIDSWVVLPHTSTIIEIDCAAD